MKVAICHLKSISPYSPSRYHGIPRENKETADDHEKRTWRERIHYDDEGTVFIPPMALKNSLAEAAKFMGRQIPGKGKSTYTKHFEAGVLVLDGMKLGIKKDDVIGEWLFLNSDGVRGSGKRVMKCCPKVAEWEGTAKFYILDDTITEPVFEEHLREAGSFIGLGRFRPRNGGFYGRFSVDQIEWADEEASAAA